MKKKLFVALTLTVMVVYLLGAFAAADLDIRQWNENLRVAVADLMGLIGAFVCLGVMHP